MDKPFQRKGSDSNTQVGRDFEIKAKDFFAERGLNLTICVSVEIGINGLKPHKFDIGNLQKDIIVECKAHTWTEGGKVPSAKMRAWNEAMYLFYITPPNYRKILFVLKDFSKKRNETLAQYYIRTYSHLIPKGIEIWEYDEKQRTAEKIN